MHLIKLNSYSNRWFYRIYLTTYIVMWPFPRQHLLPQVYPHWNSSFGPNGVVYICVNTTTILFPSCPAPPRPSPLLESYHWLVVSLSLSPFLPPRLAPSPSKTEQDVVLSMRVTPLFFFLFFGGGEGLVLEEEEGEREIHLVLFGQN